MIQGPEKEQLRNTLLRSGAVAVGFARAGEVRSDFVENYRQWIARGGHASMDYLDRHHPLRNDPRLLHPGTQTVVSLAFDYRPATRHPLFADYALGRDYHTVLRERIAPLASQICEHHGGTTRVCVDTAPVRERYWAAEAGVGTICQNGLVAVEGVGTKVFLAEVLWTEAVAPDPSKLHLHCPRCGRCTEACPGAALAACGAVTAERCNSYLTIEHRGELPPGHKFGGRIYGCDICQDVCPLNNTPGTTAIEEFRPSARLMELGLAEIGRLHSGAFNSIFRHSAVRRTKLAGLLRNAHHAKH